MERYFQISFHALILTAFVALAETGRIDVGSIVLFLVFFGMTTSRALKGQPPLLTARGAFFLSLGYIFFFVLDSLILSGSFISAIIHLVLFLEVAKLAQKKRDKDYLYLILLAFLQVLAASSLTIDISFVFTLFLFLVALVSTLMSFDIYRSQRETQDPARIPIDGPLGGMSVWATAWIVIIGVGLFFAMPRIGTGYFSRAATQALLLSGFTDTVALGEIGEVKLSSALVMRTRILSGSPSIVPKWRGLALDNFDDHTWSKSRRRRQGLRRSRAGGDEYRIQPMTGTGEAVRFEVFLEPLATPTLFGPHVIRSIAGDFRGLERDNADAVYQRIRAVRRTQYEVLSEIPLANPTSDTTDDTDLLPDDADIYLQLPSDLDPRIVDLAETVAMGADTVREKAALVEVYLRTNLAYSLQLTWDPGEQPLSTFLFEARSGHCEYFASSMAIMLRTLGIPTRMVNGFLAGEYNSIGDSYIVRQSDAHSWIEAYVPGQGWMEFDPTPPDPNRNEMSMLILISHYFDAAELFWNAYILTYDSGTQLQLFRSATETVQTLQSSLRGRSDAWAAQSQIMSDRVSAQIRKVVETRWFWFLVLCVALMGLGVKHRSAIRTQLKIWNLRMGRGDADRDVVTRLFYRVAALATPRAGARLPHQTWREWTGKLPDEKRKHLVAVALNIFEKARYSSSPVTPEEYINLEQTIQQLKSS